MSDSQKGRKKNEGRVEKGCQSFKFPGRHFRWSYEGLATMGVGATRMVATSSSACGRLEAAISDQRTDLILKVGHVFSTLAPTSFSRICTQLFVPRLEVGDGYLLLC